MRSQIRMCVLGALVLALAAAGPGKVGPDTRLLDAAKRGSTQEVKTLIGSGADVNEVYGDGMTALHWAASGGHADVATLLIQAGANVRAGTRIGGYTPLHMAARAGSTAVVEALVAAGADPNAATTNSGATPLHLAAVSGHADVIRALARLGADLNAHESESGQTPLMLAAGWNRVEAIAALAELGADVGATSTVVDVADRAKRTLAISTRFWQLMVRFMDDRGGVRGNAWPPSAAQIQAALQAAREAEAGGDPEDKEAAAKLKELVQEAMGSKGRTVSVAQAAVVGHMGGMTALLHAARAGHIDAAMELLDAGADVNQKSGDGTTPLLIAVVNGNFDLASALLARGADPNIQSDAGAAPLYGVINVQWSGTTRHTQPRVQEQQKITHLQLMEELLKAGADPNARLTSDLWYTFNVYVRADLTGTTPFWRAALGLDVDAMRLLVAYGADPNIASVRPPGDNGRGGGGEAGQGVIKGPVLGDTEVDPSGLPLVEYGGPGTFPMHVATGLMYSETFAGNEHRYVPGGWMAAVRYLVEELGADVNIRDYKGNTPLHNAAARGDDALVLYLVAHGADVMALNRRGQTTVDMANGPHGRVMPFPSTIALLERLGAKNNHYCVSC